MRLSELVALSIFPKTARPICEARGAAGRIPGMVWEGIGARALGKLPEGFMARGATRAGDCMRFGAALGRAEMGENVGGTD